MRKTIATNAVLNAWAKGTPAAKLAKRFRCSKSSIWRIVRAARSAGDKRAVTQTAALRERYEASLIVSKVKTPYLRGDGVDRIAKDLKVEPRVARAAIYLASKADASLGLGAL